MLMDTLVIADDARLAARLSCRLSRPGCYLPVLDGPRLTRHDRHAEVLRRNNAAARARSQIVYLAGLSTDAVRRLREVIPRSKIREIPLSSDLEAVPGSKLPLQWGCDRIGISLLKALRSRVDIEFSEHDSPSDHVVSKSDHIVVCEEGNELAQVIAANYAYSLRAGLHLIPKIPKEDADQLVERFYSLDAGRQPINDVLNELRARFRSLAGNIELTPSGSITFVVDALPLGFGFPEVPSTHLFSYPDLGIAIVNGFSSEQRGAPGTNVAVLVDPTPDAPDIEVAKDLLRKKRVFIRGYRGAGANVRDVAAMVELYPYDIAVIATHCGDVPGYRSTYRWTDSEGHERTLVVDEALGTSVSASCRVATGRDHNEVELDFWFVYFNPTAGTDEFVP